MSTDKQRMILAKNEISQYIDQNTLTLVINYAQYTEAELVFIALHHYKGHSDPCTWRCFTYFSENYEDDEQMYWMSIGTNPIDELTARHHNDSWEEGDEYEFNICTGEIDAHQDVIYVTIDDLLPSALLRVDDAPEYVRIAIDILRPQYLAAMQAAIDKI